MRKQINKKATFGKKALCVLTSAALVASLGFGAAFAAGESSVEGSDKGSAQSIQNAQPVATTSLSSDAQVGDTVWIKSGSLVYKSMGDNEPHKLIGKYEIEIKSITNDDAGSPVWYEFDYVGFDFWQAGQLFIKDYRFVNASSISVTEPAEETPGDGSEFESDDDGFVEGKYSSLKMSDELKGNEQYEIKTLPVTLFDYKPATMNTELSEVAGDVNPFQFRGYATSGEAVEGTNGINDSTSSYAKQGIVQAALSDEGLPVFNYVGGEASSQTSGDAGSATGKTLFGSEDINSAKTVYDNVEFEMVYDKTSGYYEYKSAANHAQLNEQETKVELYADTLSTQNKYLSTLDLSAYYGSTKQPSSALSASFNGWKEGTVGYDNEEKVWKATTKGTDTTGCLDPYVAFKVPGQSTETSGQPSSGVTKIYVKAKIPKEIGSNALKVYFTTDEDAAFSEEKSFTQTYTANGDYIEFVIETSSNENWTGNITNLRIDPFDSNSSCSGSTLDVESEYEVEIAQISLISDYDDYVTRGGFYPFTDIADSYPGNNDAFSLDSWNGVMGSDDTAAVLASRSIFSPTPASAEKLAENLFFGMVMEYDFYIPESKQVGSKDLEYYFNGDDDLWVFIDGKLALDIGGGHGAITGTINLTKGNSTVESAVTVTGYDSCKENEEGEVVATAAATNLDEKLTEPGVHTMKIFYMERCGSVSNCYMKFNMPEVPQGDVEVVKAVVDESENEITAESAAASSLCSKEFTFTISQKATNEAEGAFKAVANTNYTLFTGKEELTRSTDEKGRFTLKAGERAIFSIDESKTIKVVETNPGSTEVLSGYIYDSTNAAVTTVPAVGTASTPPENTNPLEAAGDTAADIRLVFAFKNVYKPVFGDLRVAKNGISDADSSGGKTQSSVFRVTGTSDSGTQVDMEVTIVGNASRVIRHLPVGIYTVTEVTDWSWRYDVASPAGTADADGTGSASAPTSVSVQVTKDTVGEKPATASFVNNRTDDKWLSGDCFCRNLWSKEGIASSTTQPSLSAEGKGDAAVDAS